MSKGLAYTQTEQYIRSYTDYLEDATADLPLLVESSFHGTPRRGVLCFTWEVYSVSSDKPHTTALCKYSAEFPNARCSDLPAFLFQCAVKLGRVIEVAWGDAVAAAAKNRA